MELNEIASTIRQSPQGHLLSEEAILHEAKMFLAHRDEYVNCFRRLSNRRRALARFHVDDLSDVESEDLKARIALSQAALSKLEKHYGLFHQI